MGELSFDFAEGLVVGLGIQGEEKRTLGAKWQDFTKGAITFTVRHHTHSAVDWTPCFIPASPMSAPTSLWQPS